MLIEHSLEFRSASNKGGELHWEAVTSDTGSDLRDDNMTLELYKSFVDRIEQATPVPVQYKSAFWEGGNPYLSVAHYSDQEGGAVPGVVDEVWIEDDKLMAKGRFANTPLGLACYRSVSENGLNPDVLPVRVSIAFLDYQHKHKGDDSVFIRESVASICQYCTDKKEGVEFQDGHLVHLALTRVPVNERTIMQTRSLQLADAESIIGKDLAQVIDKKEPDQQKSLVVGKSMTMQDAVEKNDQMDRYWSINDLFHTLDDVVWNILYSEGENKGDLIKQAIADFKEMLMVKSIGKLEQLMEVAMTNKSQASQIGDHPMDALYLKLRAAYDSTQDQDEAIRLKTLQEPVEEFALSIAGLIKESQGASSDDPMVALVKQQTELMSQLSQVIAGQGQQQTVRRSLTPQLIPTSPNLNGQTNINNLKPGSPKWAAAKSMGMI